MSESEITSDKLDEIEHALANAVEEIPQDPLKDTELREVLTVNVLRQLLAHARESADLGECLVIECRRVAGYCAEHLSDAQHQAWRSGWYSGSGGEDETDNPHKKLPCRCGDGHCPECGEDPAIVGYP